MTIMNRAISRLDVRKIDETESHFVIKGIATTPSTDRYGDVIEPMGVKVANEIPLLWQHKHDKPVGLASFAKAGKDGIPFEASLPKVKEVGALRDRIEEAVQSIRYRLVAAVSIGFGVLNDAWEWMENGGIRYMETEVLELSLVTIPANADATIRYIRSLDQEIRAASGISVSRGVRLIPFRAGVTAKHAVPRSGAVKLIK
jgi:HK97 family phage prohead protease